MNKWIKISDYSAISFNLHLSVDHHISYLMISVCVTSSNRIFYFSGLVKGGAASLLMHLEENEHKQL